MTYETFVTVWFLIILGGVTTYYDVRFKIIPNSCIVVGFIGALILIISGYLNAINILWSLLVLIPLTVGSLFYPKSLGMGDSKMLGILTLYTGLWIVPYGLILAFIGATVHAYISRNKIVPLAPYLSLSAITLVVVKSVV